MKIEIIVNIYSGIDWFIEYEYWINDNLWIDMKYNLAILWRKGKRLLG